MDSEEHFTISFFTATILGWKKLLCPDKYKEIIVQSMKFLCANSRVKIYGFVIMPNHVHFLWKIGQSHTLDEVQRDFMKFTSQIIKFDLKENHPEVLEKFYVNLKDRKYQFWERNFKSKFLPSRSVVEQKLDYIHNNPVQGKWMLADGPLEYKYSSIRFYEGGYNEFEFLSHYLEMFK